MTITNLRENGFGSSGIHVDDHTTIHKMLNQFAVPVNMVPDDPSWASYNAQQIQAAIDTTIDTRPQGQIAKIGGVIFLPHGDFFINSTITIQAVARLQLIGQGTRLIWNGTDDTIALLEMRDARQCTIGGFDIVANTPLKKAIDCSNVAGTAMTPVMNIFRNIYIDGNNGLLFRGVVFGGAVGAVDTNNDFNLLDAVEVSGYSDNGFTFFGSQSYNNQLVNCRAIAAAGNTGYGCSTNTVGGSLQWTGGGMFGNGAADFFIGRSYQPYIIDSFNSENSARFVEIASEAYTTLHIRGVRWYEDSLHVDGRMITGTPTQCHVKIESSSMGELTGQEVREASLYINPSDPDSCLIVENTRIKTTLANAFTGIQPTRAEGVWYW